MSTLKSLGGPGSKPAPAPAPGRYKVSYTSLVLVVDATTSTRSMYLSGRATAPSAPGFIEFVIPLEPTASAPDAAVTEAREQVLDYLAAAYPYHYWDDLNAWMAHKESEVGLEVWLGFRSSAPATALSSDIDRGMVDKEVDAWLKKLTSAKA